MAVIEAENLVKRSDVRAVVDDISFAVEAGEIFAILGPNGAGKTTTRRLLPYSVGSEEPRLIP